MSLPRYSVRANPQVKEGPMVTLSFRVPASVRKIFEERVAELADDPNEPGITNITDAGQDAIVRWCIIEGK